MASLAPKVRFWSCMACAQVLDSLLMPLTCPTVTGGLAAGTYKLCSINSAAVRLGRAYLLLSKGITDKTSPLTEPPAGARRCRSARLARRSVSCRHFRGPKLVLTSSFPSDQTAFTSPPVLEAMPPLPLRTLALLKLALQEHSPPSGPVPIVAGSRSSAPAGMSEHGLLPVRP